MNSPTAYLSKRTHSLLAVFLPIWNARYCYVLSLMMLVQRSPVVRHLTEMVRHFSPNRFADLLKISVPIGVHVGTTHAVTGATGVVPAGGSVSPAEAKVGEPFTWVFRTTGEKAKSYDITGLPPGLSDSDTVSNAVSSFGGVPTEPGTFQVKIIGWEKSRQRGRKTPTYTLTVNVTGSALSPFEEWRRTYWTEAELNDGASSGPGADPDQDGLTNLMEYVSGGDPTTSNATEQAKPQLEIVSGAPYITTRFPRSMDRADIESILEITVDLASQTWEPLVDGVNGVSIQQTNDMLIVKVPATGAQGFIRHRALLP